MITILQILGIVIPALFILIVYYNSIVQCNKGNGSKPAPAWLVFLLLLSLMVFGFTSGTILSLCCK